MNESNGTNKLLKDLLVNIVSNMCDYPDDASVFIKNGDSSLSLEISAHKRDIGKLIGKQGRNIEAMRTIMSCVSARYQKKVFVNILNQ